MFNKFLVKLESMLAGYGLSIKDIDKIIKIIKKAKRV